MTVASDTPSTGGRDPRTVRGAWSVPATRQVVLDQLEGLDWSSAKVCDVGAGAGHFSQVLCEFVRERHGREPRAHVFACDMDPSIFHFDEIDCDRSDPDGRFPYDDDTFDAAVCIEVIEHVEDQFGFFRELARIVKPGGRVVVTTPNTLNLNSRLRTLLVGFPLLFDPLPLSAHDARFLGGHIHPIGPYYLAYDGVRAGLTNLSLTVDRIKSSAVVLAILFAPLLLLGRFLARRRLASKYPDVLAENDALVRAVWSLPLLTGRTTVLRGFKPV